MFISVLNLNMIESLRVLNLILIRCESIISENGFYEGFLIKFA